MGKENSPELENPIVEFPGHADQYDVNGKPNTADTGQKLSAVNGNSKTEEDSQAIHTDFLENPEDEDDILAGSDADFIKEADVAAKEALADEKADKAKAAEILFNASIKESPNASAAVKFNGELFDILTLMRKQTRTLEDAYVMLKRELTDPRVTSITKQMDPAVVKNILVKTLEDNGGDTRNYVRAAVANYLKRDLNYNLAFFKHKSPGYDRAKEYAVYAKPQEKVSFGRKIANFFSRKRS